MSDKGIKGLSPAKRTAVCGAAAALLIGSQVALSSLPNIELVSLLIIIYTKLFDRMTIPIIYTFVLAEGLIYGFGIWWIMYLYIWFILYLLIKLIPVPDDSPLFYAVISGAFGLFFGTLCSIPYFFILGPGGGLSWIASGLLFDAVHAVGNFTVAMFLYRPIYKAGALALRSISGNKQTLSD